MSLRKEQNIVFYHNLTIEECTSAPIRKPWVAVYKKSGVDHPTTPTVGGVLCRNESTGIYALIAGGTLSSCPQDWAAMLDEKRTDVPIKKIREAAGYTQKELAEILAVSIWTLRKYEQGKRRPSSLFIRNALLLPCRERLARSAHPALSEKPPKNQA